MQGAYGTPHFLQCAGNDTETIKTPEQNSRQQVAIYSIYVPRTRWYRPPELYRYVVSSN